MNELPIISDCDSCGAGCMDCGTPPFTNHERDLLTEELLAEIDAVESKRTQRDEEIGPCIWFDPVTLRCKHYDDRPFICEQFETGGESCRESRRRRGIAGSIAIQRDEVQPARPSEWRLDRLFIVAEPASDARYPPPPLQSYDTTPSRADWEQVRF